MASILGEKGVRLLRLQRAHALLLGLPDTQERRQAAASAKGWQASVLQKAATRLAGSKHH